MFVDRTYVNIEQKDIGTEVNVAPFFRAAIMTEEHQQEENVNQV